MCVLPYVHSSAFMYALRYLWIYLFIEFLNSLVRSAFLLSSFIYVALPLFIPFCCSLHTSVLVSGGISLLLYIIIYFVMISVFRYLSSPTLYMSWLVLYFVMTFFLTFFIHLVAHFVLPLFINMCCSSFRHFFLSLWLVSSFCVLSHSLVLSLFLSFLWGFYKRSPASIKGSCAAIKSTLNSDSRSSSARCLACRDTFTGARVHHQQCSCRTRQKYEEVVVCKVYSPSASTLHTPPSPCINGS
jgi:hypothetical protein